MSRRIYLLVLLTLFSASSAQPQSGDIAAFIEKLNKLPVTAPQRIEFEIRIEQPLDHRNPEGEKFPQRLLISHVGRNRPVVLVTEGYSLRNNYCRELAELLKANEIRVEHRYFGESRPDSLRWEFLNIRQAAADHHRVVELFREIYPGPWVNTGWSKGGQTAMYHRRFYPDDVAATVCYDSELNLAREEPRIDRFFDKVGTAGCRQKIRQFQRAVLNRRQEILPMLEFYARERGYSYSIGLNAVLEYAVLEYPFSFWQYHKIDCAEIPAIDSPAWMLFEHLRRVVSFWSYSDAAMNSPAMYQFATELGYYGYVTKHVQDLLQARSDYSNFIFAPPEANLSYRPEVMRDVNEWIQKEGRRMLFIYGRNDPWSAPEVETGGNPHLLKMILEGGNHYTFIRSFPKITRDKILTILQDWLGSAPEQPDLDRTR